MMHKSIITMAFLVFSISLHAASGFVVIASIDSAISKGEMLGRSQVIELNAGEALTLLSANGKVIQLKGPYHGAIDSEIEEGDADILRSISKLVKYSGNEDLSLAAFRNIASSTQSNLPEIWSVDIDQSGQYCMRADLSLNLRWPDAFKGAVITLTNNKTLKQEKFRWATKEQHIKWPTNFALQKDATYKAGNNVSEHETIFSLVVLPDDIGNDMNRIVWMFEHSCRRQALRLLKEVIRPPEGS